MCICHTERWYHPRAEFTSDAQSYENTPPAAKFMPFICLTVCGDRTVPRGITPLRRRTEGQECCAGRVGDLGEEGGAQEALTGVEDLHGGVGVWMLFMDHLSADLLRKNLPGDRHRAEVINIGRNNNRETNAPCLHRALRVFRRHVAYLLNNCQIKCVQVARRKHYYFTNYFHFAAMKQ